jgi:hypothetical protein
MHIGRDYFWIQIIRLDDVDDGDHHYTRKYDRDLITAGTVSVSEYKYRYTREKCPKYRDKASDKDDKGKGKYKWKWGTTMDDADNNKSYGSEDSIDQSDNRLCLKNQSKSSPHFPRDDRPFQIEKLKIPIFYLPEKFFYPFPVDDEEVREHECDEKFGKYDPRVRDI